MTVDFFVVGLVINRSLEMFTSVLGTWIPFALIFASTWLAGRLTTPNMVMNPTTTAEGAAIPAQRTAA